MPAKEEEEETGKELVKGEKGQVGNKNGKSSGKWDDERKERTRRSLRKECTRQLRASFAIRTDQNDGELGIRRSKRSF